MIVDVTRLGRFHEKRRVVRDMVRGSCELVFHVGHYLKIRNVDLTDPLRPLRSGQPLPHTTPRFPLWVLDLSRFMIAFMSSTGDSRVRVFMFSSKRKMH